MEDITSVIIVRLTTLPAVMAPEITEEWVTGDHLTALDLTEDQPKEGEVMANKTENFEKNEYNWALLCSIYLTITKFLLEWNLKKKKYTSQTL